MYPAAPRRMMSRACVSGTSVSCSETGAPVSRSALTTWVPPRRAHSFRMARSEAFCVVRLTLPSWNSSLTAWALTGPAQQSSRAAYAATRVMLIFNPARSQYTSAASSLSVRFTRSAGPDVLDHTVNNLLEVQLRLVTNESADLRNVRNAPRHVLETCLVGLVVRNHLDRRGAGGHGLDLLCQVENRDLANVADVEHLANRARFVREPDQRLDDVADVGEAARLGPVAEDGNRVTGQRLAHERRQHHAVLPGLPRTHCIE